jgi:hypothetical protein
MDSSHCTCSLRLRPEQEFILYFSDLWKPKSEGFGYIHMTQGMKEDPTLQMRIEKMISRHVYDKLFMVRFLDRSEGIVIIWMP